MLCRLLELLTHRHRQQCLGVMHHRLQALSDRVETGQSQQVESSGAQGCRHSSAVDAVAVVVLMKLGVTDSVPALDAPTLSCQSQQRFWGGAQAGDESVRRLEPLAITDPGAITSVIQLVPCQFALMCSGASFALNVQRMSRPCVPCQSG